ncbi:MAG: hypothetical protein Q7U57_02760 [Methylovulum sp.]|nr:hypothetical protein [Methylovulum sp.]
MQELRKDMDKRFEQAGKHFETLTIRIDRFMVGPIATTLTTGGMVLPQ